jgi:hypothetical protein
MIKVNCILLSVLIGMFICACGHKTEMRDVAAYVGNPVNGLVKKEKADSTEITCQWVPDSSKTSWLFRVYMYSPEKVDDSTLYKMNYKTQEIFALIHANDTARPVLAERVANGRRDQHEFTVVFDPVKQDSAKTVSLLLAPNGLLRKNISFDFQYNDITKAQKKLYGYSSL